MTYKRHYSKLAIFWFNLLIISILIIACNNQENKIQQPIQTTMNPACVQQYDGNRDYFSEKINITYAKGFNVEYHKNYKIVTIKEPWKDATTAFQYILVQCGTPLPQDFSQKDLNNTQIINVPVNSVIALSTTHLPHLAKLGLVDKLIGISDAKTVNTPEVVAKMKAEKLVTVGSDNSINIEKVLELNPELIMTYGSGNPTIDSYPKLLESGLKVVINAEYMEDSPLGRSEWLKFTALFFNQEKNAEEIFTKTAKRYTEIATKAKSTKTRPTVFVGSNFKGTWYISGGKSYAAKYLEDAGANYLWRDNQSSGSLPLSFETISDRANNADYWLNFNPQWQQKQDILSEDNRYGDFKAVKNGNLYNNNARVNESGGNDYWEGGISNPDVVLSDLIKIFHPGILPKHKLVFYRHVN
ncbi:ABC transporter substrate-binding protein [Calothrix sp. UHCC 0171]|uniref:ABC transporter substrate-binding protein n=1 Tax=Calothrix sp. UHCC 0171 TaxID=3110245 RepID=UPI002B1F75D8|nr:ABC transporter substrate-binding protein [Calothrix sp. UHCC 0171]MEA5570945.1 ABC transporter substrate-binding protein [Calothrix sp. UHCC 0171]